MSNGHDPHDRIFQILRGERPDATATRAMAASTGPRYQPVLRTEYPFAADATSASMLRMLGLPGRTVPAEPQGRTEQGALGVLFGALTNPEADIQAAKALIGLGRRGASFLRDLVRAPKLPESATAYDAKGLLGLEEVPKPLQLMQKEDAELLRRLNADYAVQKATGAETAEALSPREMAEKFGDRFSYDETPPFDFLLMKGGNVRAVVKQNLSGKLTEGLLRRSAAASTEVNEATRHLVEYLFKKAGQVVDVTDVSALRRAVPFYKSFSKDTRTLPKRRS